MDLEMLAAGQDGAPLRYVVFILELERLAQAANDLGCNNV